LPCFLLILLVISCGIIWHKVYLRSHQGYILKVAFLDIGQGDAIYIEAPNGRQMLIDSGPGPIILSKLAAVMPFGDRSLDLVLATHTDADHIGGFPSVFENYKVGEIVENGASSDTDIYASLENEISNHAVGKVIARRGMRIVLDRENDIYFDILYPDRDVSHFTEANDGSIVGKLVYGDESFMLTGDATKYVENLIMHNESDETLKSEVLKLGHHGSHTSSSELWLSKVQPSLAIISAGLHNRYGHPHKEVLDLLAKLKIPFLATYQKGTIIFKTDGSKLSYP
jgi:competence protein ComEC